MKIAVFHNQPSGGARRALHGFLSELVQRHTVDVFTLTSADQEMLDDQDVATSVTRMEFAFPHPVRGQLYLNDLRRRQGFRRLREVNREAAERIDSGGYDVALVDTCRFQGAPPILEFMATPSVYFCHHRLFTIDDLPRAPAASAYAWVRDRIHGPFEQWLLRDLWESESRLTRLPARVLTNSDFTRRRMKQVFGVESTVCRYGVRIPTSCPTGAGSGHVLSVGTLEEHKGHDLVIEALSLLPPSTRPRLLLIANDGNPGVRARLVAQAAQAEVDLEISILPRQEELDQAYADASLLAFAGIDEPLGLVVLEAMAHSIPVVAVAEGGVLETVAPGRSGYLVPRQPQAMADRIAELVADPDRAREMGREGRRIVETDWNWPDRAAFLESILESVAVPRPRLVPTGVGG